MIVADASLVVSLLLDLQPVADRAWSRLEGFRRLHVPEIFDLELASALRGLVRGRQLEPERAHAILSGPMPGLAVRHYRHDPLLERIWVLRHNLSPYDASYVALAEALEAPLLTEDRGIAHAPGVRCEVELFA